MLDNKTQMVAYVGKKDVKIDTVAGTGILWAGYGDVQEVPHVAAVKMLQHPDVWVTEAKFKAAQNKEPVDPPKDPVDPPVAPAGLDNAVTPKAPEAPESLELNPEKQEAIKAILVELINTNNPDDFTETNKPKMDAVKSKMGSDVTVKELNAAWKAVNGN